MKDQQKSPLSVLSFVDSRNRAKIAMRIIEIGDSHTHNTTNPTDHNSWKRSVPSSDNANQACHYCQPFLALKPSQLLFIN